MSNYYEHMSKEFKKAVEVIKKYCQFEDCGEDCEECPFPLKTIRCGDSEFERVSEDRGGAKDGN